MTNELLTFTNCKHTKAELLESLRRHADLDQIVQGAYWENGKGCAVGCSMRDFAPGKEADHAQYEALFGVAEEMARLEDKIFEGLPAHLAKTWPLRFTQAIPEGVSLTVPLAKFKVFLLTEVCEFDRDKNPSVALAVDYVVALLGRRILGDEPTGLEWAAAGYAARSAGAAAGYAAWSAAWSVAESAAWSAVSAADSAARSAGSAAGSAWSAAQSPAAWSAAWVKVADKLIQILEETK